MKVKNSKKIITAVEKIVEDACKAESNVFGYGIWSHHITQVVKIGKSLAKKFNADAEIVEIAALLHDYAGIKDHKLHKEHHIHSANAATKILRKLNYSEVKIEAVKHCIQTHRGSVKNHSTRSCEANCLANADAIAHIENIPSLFFLVYNKFKMEIDEGAMWLSKKLKRSWNKLNPEMKKMVKNKFKAANQILDSLIS